jgi:hypothetical protein
MNQLLTKLASWHIGSRQLDLKVWQVILDQPLQDLCLILCEINVHNASLAQKTGSVITKFYASKWSVGTPTGRARLRGYH